MKEASGAQMVNVRLRRASLFEAKGDASIHVVILRMEIDNLMDSDLYIESSYPMSEKGKRRLWFVVKEDNGNKHELAHCSDIEDAFPISVSPGTTTTGEVAFAIPRETSSVTLEVIQKIGRMKSPKVIYTKEISFMNIHG